MRYSVEIFPPKEQDPIDLAVPFISAGASFISVTYGAGGSSRNRSRSAVLSLALSGVPTAAHITAVGESRDEIDSSLAIWLNTGVTRFVALRGDATAGPGEPFEPHPNGYKSSIELIERIAELGGKQISVAAYPNGHPDQQGGDSDLDYLKRKVDAGATEAITQFFFDADDYLRFRDRCAAAGIGIDIVPGILPIFNFAKVAMFATKCGEPLPQWLIDRFAGLDAKPDIRHQIAVATASALVDRLREEDAPRIHLYSVNNADLAMAVGRLITFPEATANAA